MSEPERAYVGMAVDTDGHICIPVSSKPKSWRVGFSNTQVELVATILRVVGAGRVHYVAPYKNHPQPGWVWYLSSYYDVVSLLHQIKPYSLKAQVELPAIVG